MLIWRRPLKQTKRAIKLTAMNEDGRLRGFVERVFSVLVLSVL